MRKILAGIILMAAAIASPLLTAFAADGLPLAYLEWVHKIQAGYSPEFFTKIDMTMHNRVAARNQAEQIVNGSFEAADYATYTTRTLEYLQMYNMDQIRQQVAQINQQCLGVAAANGEFSYVPNSDGKISYFKDGLVSTVLHERVVDEFGNVNLKDTRNMQYNDKRLLVSYDALQKDIDGNFSLISFYGAQYSEDSVFYGTQTTNANKNMLEYYIKEVDPLGNVTYSHQYGTVFAGKFVDSFSQTTDSDLYGSVSFTRSKIIYDPADAKKVLSYEEKGVDSEGFDYTTIRSATKYNDKAQITGYEQQTTTYEKDGSLRQTVIEEGTFTYAAVDTHFGPDVEEPDPDKQTQAQVTTKIVDPDGEVREEFSTTNYHYDSLQQLVAADGVSIFVDSDGQGNYSLGGNTSTYALFHGRPELIQTDAVSYSLDQDESARKEISTTAYIRNWYGILTDAHTEASFSGTDKLDLTVILDPVDNFAFQQLIDLREMEAQQPGIIFGGFGTEEFDNFINVLLKGGDK